MRCLDKVSIAAYAARDLARPETERVEAHLSDCSVCRELAEALESSSLNLGTLRMEPSADRLSQIRVRVLERIAAQQQLTERTSFRQWAIGWPWKLDWLYVGAAALGLAIAAPIALPLVHSWRHRPAVPLIAEVRPQQTVDTQAAPALAPPEPAMPRNSGVAVTPPKQARPDGDQVPPDPGQSLAASDADAVTSDVPIVPETRPPAYSAIEPPPRPIATVTVPPVAPVIPPTTARALSPRANSRPPAMAPPPSTGRVGLVGVLGGDTTNETAGLAETKDSLEKKLKTQFPLTSLTADGKDVVTAGSVFTLKKDGLVLTPPDANDVSGNSYKAGTITQNATGKTNEKAKKIGGFLGRIPVPLAGSSAAGTATGSANATRTFVAGEKLNITKIEYRDGSVVFEVVSAKGYGDQNSIYYHGALTFPVDKGSVPAGDVMLKVIEEVFAVDPPNYPSEPSPATMPAPAASYADVPPPPPPPAPAPTGPARELRLGMTIDQVVALLGQPTTTASAGNKQIYLFKDWKITFSAGKVSDIDVR